MNIRRQTNQSKGGRVTPPRAAIQRLGGGPSCKGGSIRVLPRLQDRARESHAAPVARNVVLKASAVRLISHLKQRATTPLSAIFLKP